MDEPATEQLIVALETQYWNAIRDKDAETMLQLSDDVCLISGAHGVRSVDQPTMAELLTSGALTLNRFDIADDVRVSVLSDDVAVIAYTVHQEMTSDGHVVIYDAVDASTWIRRNGQWRCAQHSEAVKTQA